MRGLLRRGYACSHILISNGLLAQMDPAQLYAFYAMDMLVQEGKKIVEANEAERYVKVERTKREVERTPGAWRRFGRFNDIVGKAEAPRQRERWQVIGPCHARQLALSSPRRQTTAPGSSLSVISFSSTPMFTPLLLLGLCVHCYFAK